MRFPLLTVALPFFASWAVADSLKINVDDCELQIVHRMPSRNDPPAIIAKFNNQDKKAAIIKASKIKKLDTSFLGITPATPIFCDDHLIPENKRILAKAKQLKKEGVLKYVWLHDCTIKIRMSDNTPVITIHNESQIDDIIEKL